MRFTLKHLGRLEEATIDLRHDLIVLTGPNNTSKTYVAHAIYGFCKHIDSALSEVARELLPRDEAVVESLPLDVADLLRSQAAGIYSRLADAYRKELADVFAVEEAFTARTEVTITDVDAGMLEAFTSSFVSQEYHNRHVGLDDVIPSVFVYMDKSAGTGVITARIIQGDVKGGQSWLRVLAAAYLKQILTVALFPLLHRPYLLTAERSAIQLFSRELSIRRSETIDAVLLKAKSGNGGDPLAMLTQRARRYSLPTRDSLRIADDLAALRKSTSAFASLADRLEREILGGSIGIGEDGEMTFQPEGAPSSISMHVASSSVKALSGLSFYLRHLAAKNDFLIIDEPELNLHPDNQRRVAKLLARVARSGIKVMISTHSDYVIRELNNAIMLSADKTGELRRKYNYEEEDTLSPENVGAYLFDERRAHPIEVKATGIEVKTIDEEINKLNASSQDIYFLLFENRAP